ncbi:MAG TPA: sigma-70 family RNA polymerase sigma factor [Pseudonocardia sp.]
MRRAARGREVGGDVDLAIEVEADPDDALVLRIIDRDQEAFEDVYTRHAAAVYGVARRVLRDPALAEDVAQEVFLDFWRRPERFDGSRGALQSWLVTIAHRRSVDVVRSAAARRSVYVDVVDDLGPPSEDAQDATLRRAEADTVQHALAALPTDQRRALLLAYWGGHTQVEIAALTGVPVGTVKSRVFGGFRRLRTLLCAAGEGPSGGAR